MSEPTPSSRAKPQEVLQHIVELGIEARAAFLTAHGHEAFQNCGSREQRKKVEHWSFHSVLRASQEAEGIGEAHSTEEQGRVYSGVMDCLAECGKYKASVDALIEAANAQGADTSFIAALQRINASTDTYIAAASNLRESLGIGPSSGGLALGGGQGSKPKE